MPSAIAAPPALRAELAALPALTQLAFTTPATSFLLQHGVTAVTAAAVGPNVTKLDLGPWTLQDAIMQGLPPHLATQFPRVRELQLGGFLDDAAADVVLALPCLKRFACGWTQLTRSFVERLEGPTLEWRAQTLDVASYALLPLEPPHLQHACASPGRRSAVPGAYRS